jgi:hypothetical protein
LTAAAPAPALFTKNSQKIHTKNLIFFQKYDIINIENKKKKKFEMKETQL